MYFIEWVYDLPAGQHVFSRSEFFSDFNVAITSALFLERCMSLLLEAKVIYTFDWYIRYRNPCEVE